jgi:hypothetical protein
MKKPTIRTSKSKSLKKQCDALWTYAIKLRAGFKSEISGKDGRQIGGGVVLTAHHIFGKNNNRLRYDLKNGICLDNHSEHIWGVHNRNNSPLAYSIHEQILKKIGKETEKYLQELRRFNGKTDLRLTKVYLEEEIKKLELK